MAAAPSQPPRKLARALRPRDAATLIIVRRDGNEPRVLMGRRHADHAFMPGKYVFPGGRVDAGDCRVKPARDLDPMVADKLLVKMRGRPSLARARGLAMAAVRETFEEVGLIIGTPRDGAPSTRSPAWQAFLATGYAPDLSGLRYFARAITPPGRPRRFDTRFLTIEASYLANPDAPVRTPTQEILDPCWVSIKETAGLDLPNITKNILRRLNTALEESDGLRPGAPLPFHYHRAKSWVIETI